MYFGSRRTRSAWNFRKVYCGKFTVESFLQETFHSKLSTVNFHKFRAGDFWGQGSSLQETFHSTVNFQHLNSFAVRCYLLPWEKSLRGGCAIYSPAPLLVFLKFGGGVEENILRIRGSPAASPHTRFDPFTRGSKLRSVIRKPILEKSAPRKKQWTLRPWENEELQTLLRDLPN